jgi:quercetin dioxygenase-like cupin family protein
MSNAYNPNLIGFFNLDRLPQHDKGTMTQRLISGTQGMAVWSKIKAGTHTPSHSHPNEQIMLITAGRMDFRLQDEIKVCLPGDMILIPGDVEHEVWYREECDVVEFFSPPRYDLYPAAANNPFGLDAVEVRPKT